MAHTRIWVFDVEQGSAAFIRAPSGLTAMIDCGKRDDFSPALYVYDEELTSAERDAARPLTKLVVTHPHDDHIEDIATVRDKLRPQVIRRQRYDWEEIEGESDGDYENLQDWAEFQEPYNVTPEPLDWGGLTMTHGYLTPDQAKELNEAKFINNSSVVTVLEVNSTKVVFPGDIEADGWEQLLGASQRLRDAIAGADVFVTSHHGHSSGYTSEIFDVMGKPSFNFSSIHHGDENVEAAYSSSDRAIGVQVNGTTRYHLTTRKDGALKLEIDENGKITFDLYPRS